jgi:hypothetical protein
VVEVVIENKARLPDEAEVAESMTGPWRKL